MPESLGPSARTLTARGPWGLVWGGGGKQRPYIALEVGHCARRAPPRHLGERPEQGRGLRTDAHGSIYRKAGRADGTDVPSYREPTFVSERRERALPVQDRRI